MTSNCEDIVCVTPGMPVVADGSCELKAEGPDVFNSFAKVSVHPLEPDLVVAGMLGLETHISRVFYIVEPDISAEMEIFNVPCCADAEVMADGPFLGAHLLGLVFEEAKLDAHDLVCGCDGQDVIPEGSLQVELSKVPCSDDVESVSAVSSFGCLQGDL